MFVKLDLFLNQLFGRLETAGVDVSSYLMDHVCYRVPTLQRYEELRHALARYCDESPYESFVNGRPITVFTLACPPTILGRIVRVIELPAPKPDNSFAEGWEHAEFVIDEPFDAFMKRYPNLDFDTKSLNKELNPELGLRLGRGLQVKFHHKPLSAVVEIEREKGLALTTCP